MPRKSRAMVTRRESNVNVVVDNDNKNNNVDSSQVGSKRLEVDKSKMRVDEIMNPNVVVVR